MARWGFVFDQEKCIGCNACQMACKDHYDLEAGLFFRRAVTVQITEDGINRWVHYSGACNHCADPACVKHCPTGAYYVREDGTVGHHPEKCIGCGTCTWACPYGAPHISPRRGISMKCTSCPERRAEGRKPLCVEACLTHCLSFADLDALPEKEKREMTASLPFLPSPERTKPSLLIKKKKNFPSIPSEAGTASGVERSAASGTDGKEDAHV